MEKRQTIISLEARDAEVPSVPCLELGAVEEMEKEETCFLACEWAGLDQEPYCMLTPNGSPTTGFCCLEKVSPWLAARDGKY